MIVGGGSAGSALANRLSADPATSVLVLEAGRPDYKWDVFIHMPAALTFPIGCQVLRLEVRERARAVHERPQDLPRPRQGARRLEQHQRDDLPTRQPARLRALGRRPGHGDLGLRPLPAVLQEDGELPGRRRWPIRSTVTAVRWRWSAARRPIRLFGAFFEAVQQAGYPITADVNGFQQEGFAKFDRNVRRGRRLSAARAYLHPVMNRPNLTVTTRALVHRVLFDGTRATGVEYSTRRGGDPQRHRRRGDPVRRRLQLAAVAAAERCRQRQPS